MILNNEKSDFFEQFFYMSDSSLYMRIFHVRNRINTVDQYLLYDT